VDASRFQQAMEPEAVIAGIIAGVDLGGLLALSSCRAVGPIKKSEQALGIATGDLVKAHLAQMRQAKSDNPLRIAELDGCKNLAALASAVGGSSHAPLSSWIINDAFHWTAGANGDSMGARSVFRKWRGRVGPPQTPRWTRAQL
jgi:hypothetical protein